MCNTYIIKYKIKRFTKQEIQNSRQITTTYIHLRYGKKTEQAVGSDSCAIKVDKSI